MWTLMQRTIRVCTAVMLLLTAHGLVLAAEPAAPEESFTIVLLPDTQNYAEKYPETYIAQTLWIRERRKVDNIKFAIHLGDIVQTATH